MTMTQKSTFVFPNPSLLLHSHYMTSWLFLSFFMFLHWKPEPESQMFSFLCMGRSHPPDMRQKIHRDRQQKRW